MLRINAPPFAARSPAFTELLLEYSRRYADMHVDLVTEGQLSDIVAEGFDLGVRVASLIPSDMIALSLGEHQRFRSEARRGGKVCVSTGRSGGVPYTIKKKK